MSIDSSQRRGQSPEAPRKPRRWPQFSLRSLFVVTLLAALPLSWIATRRLGAVRESAAIRDIREMAGQFGFYGREDLFGWKAPVWLHKLTGGGPRTAHLWFQQPSIFADADVELLLRLDPLPAASLPAGRLFLSLTGASRHGAKKGLSGGRRRLPGTVFPNIAQPPEVPLRVPIRAFFRREQGIQCKGKYVRTCKFWVRRRSAYCVPGRTEVSVTGGWSSWAGVHSQKSGEGISGRLAQNSGFDSWRVWFGFLPPRRVKGSPLRGGLDRQSF